jgi:restriction endonuclease S subunit
MAVSSAYNISQLGPNIRLDASYYQPQYFDNRRLLQRLSWSLVRLGNVAYITNGQTPRKADLSVGDVLFLTAESVHDLRIDYASAKRILSEHHTGELKRTILKENDVLVTIKGRAGNAAVVMEPPSEVNINQDVARVVLQRRDLSPFYVSAFIVSKYGRLQVEQLITDQINPFLGLGNLQRIQIPVMPLSFQKQIEAIVRQAHTTSVQYQALYRQAEQLLLDKLGLSDLDRSLDLSGEASVFDAFCASRIDSDFFEPKYDRLQEHMYNLSAQSVGDMARLRQEKFSPQKGVSFSYIEISDVNLSNGLCHASEVPGEEAPDRAQQIVRTGDIVVSTVRPLRGGIALIRPNQDGFVCSSGFAVLEPLRVSAEYLLVYLRLKPIRELLNRSNRASMYPAVTASDVLNLPIIVSDDNEMTVRGLIQESHQAYSRELELLEQAKRKVEAMIESEAAHG